MYALATTSSLYLGLEPIALLSRAMSAGRWRLIASSCAAHGRSTFLSYRVLVWLFVQESCTGLH
jgi:hypothetical protein